MHFRCLLSLFCAVGFFWVYFCSVLLVIFVYFFFVEALCILGLFLGKFLAVGFFGVFLQSFAYVCALLFSFLGF